MQHMVSIMNKECSYPCTDTDVVVLTIAVASLFTNCSRWITFGHAKHSRDIPAHTIPKHLDLETSFGLLLLHAISGCDTVLAFIGVD